MPNIITNLIKKISADRDATRRAEMAKMGLDPFEQDAALALVKAIESGSPAERQTALTALREMVESARLRGDGLPPH